MEKEESYYKELLQRYLENRCNPKEMEEVMDFLAKDSSNRLLLQQIKEQFQNPATKNSQITEEQSTRIREALLQKVNEAPVISMHRRSRWRLFAAAAAILILMGGGLYFFLSGRYGQEPGIAQTGEKKKFIKNDVPPGGDKAVLTLADGSTIVLDDARDGALTQQGNTKVIKLGGKLAYDPAGNESKEVVYNTISTPRGGQYQIELPDGSGVWLNAASSLRFPTAFSGRERRVEITGEAYFEVAANKNMPFVVRVNGAEVQVLGTHFNVMAYSEEEVVKTTLLEGSVKFVNGNNTSLLRPGQQSQLKKDGQVKVVSGVDVSDVVAWKNGMFHFEMADIETVMRQLSRWYDVEVVFKSKKEYDPLRAEIPRNTKLSDALKALELAGSAKFDIEGKRIVVRQ